MKKSAVIKGKGKYFSLKDAPGLRWIEHPTRLCGGVVKEKDQYFYIYYSLNGKRREEGCGWASEGMTAKKALKELAVIKDHIRLGEGYQSLKEKRAIEQKRRDAEEAAAAKASKDLISFAQYWEKHYLPAQVKKPKVIDTEKSYFKKWLDPVIGSLPFNKITILHFQKIRKDMIEEGKAMRTIQYVLAQSRQVWNQARISGYAYTDWPFKTEMKKIKPDNARMRFLSPQQLFDLLANLKDRSQQLHDISLLGWQCGLRAGEIFALRWSNVNTEEGILNILDAKAGSRTAYMTTQVREMFKGMKAGKPEDLIFRKKYRVKEGSEEIKMEVSNSFDRGLVDLHINDGITDRREKFVFHSLRHCYASHLIAAGISLQLVKRLMGHSTRSGNITERYIHADKNMLQEAVKRFEEYIKVKEKRKQESKFIQITNA